LVGGLAGIATDVPIVTKPCAAILDSPYPDTILGGTPHPRCASWWHRESRCAPWWHLASSLRALVAPRIPFTARDGVGAVQNRRPDHRVISTVCGDAGRPAHQRPETPRCATHHHDRFAPVCGPTARRFAPGPPTNAPKHPAARGADSRRFAPACGPTGRRFAPRRTHKNRRFAPACGPAMRRFAPRRSAERRFASRRTPHVHGTWSVAGKESVNSGQQMAGDNEQSLMSPCAWRESERSPCGSSAAYQFRSSSARGPVSRAGRGS
jgi:hypothetical protein